MEEADNIKALFWNIGKNLTDKKIELLNEATLFFKPNIFCIAEGSISKDDCRKIEYIFSNNGYNTFYSPLFSDQAELQPSYSYFSWGLKIFISKGTVIKNAFSFADQRQMGRIVLLKIFFNYKEIAFIFLHNKSKEGETHETLSQTDNIKAIYDMVSVGKTIPQEDRIIIMGDFNLFPWDRLLEHKEFLNTSYFQNRSSILQRHEEKCYYNPIVDYLSQSKTPNLAGTYHSNKSGWALFDFILYDKKDHGEPQFDIITKFNQTILLNPAPEIKKSFFNYGIDHLPIITTITK